MVWRPSIRRRSLSRSPRQPTRASLRSARISPPHGPPQATPSSPPRTGSLVVQACFAGWRRVRTSRSSRRMPPLRPDTDTRWRSSPATWARARWSSPPTSPLACTSPSDNVLIAQCHHRGGTRCRSARSPPPARAEQLQPCRSLSGVRRAGWRADRPPASGERTSARAGRSMPVDACRPRCRQALTVHLLGLDLLGHRVGEP